MNTHILCEYIHKEIKLYFIADLTVLKVSQNCTFHRYAKLMTLHQPPAFGFSADEQHFTMLN